MLGLPPIVIMSDQNTAFQNIGSVGDAAYQTFVEFPYRALTTPRLAELPAKDEKDMGKSHEKTERHVQDQKFTSPISDQLLKLLTSPDSVSTLLAQDPSLTPGEAWKKLYGHHVGKLGDSPSIDEIGKHLASEEALHRAAEAGHWGPTQPSELFLRVSSSCSPGKCNETDTARSTMMPQAHCMMIPPTQWSARPSWEAVV